MPRRRKDEDENQFKGFSRAGRRRGQPPEVADERGAHVQVALVYRGMGRGEYSHVGLKSPSQWELSRHLKDMARARIPPSARPRGFSHVALSSLRMAVEAGEIEPSHVLSPINFFVWTLSGVKVQSYTNRDAIPKRSVFHSTH